MPQRNWQKNQYKGTQYRGPYWSKYNKASGVVSRLATDVSKIKKALNTELKVKDVTINETPTSTGWSAILLNGLAQGDDDDNRQGRVVQINSLYVNIAILINSAALGTFCRVLVVQDKQCNGAAPALADVIADTTYNWVAPLNTDQSFRFRVLHDDKIALTKSGVNSYVCSFYKDFGQEGKKVKFDGTTSGVVDIATNSIYMFLISSEPTNIPSMQGYTRIRYVDN